MKEVTEITLERAMVQVQTAAVALGDAISALSEMIVGVATVRGVQNPSSIKRHLRFDHLQSKRKPASSGTLKEAIDDVAKIRQGQ